MTIASEDKVEIQELSARYANALDCGDIESWLDTWDAECIWEGGPGRFEGKDGLRNLHSVLKPRLEGRRHVMTSFVITGDGISAQQTCYMLIFDRVTEPKLIATGIYKDSLKKVGDQWKFVHRS